MNRVWIYYQSNWRLHSHKCSNDNDNVTLTSFHIPLVTPYSNELTIMQRFTNKIEPFEFAKFQNETYGIVFVEFCEQSTALKSISTFILKHIFNWAKEIKSGKSGKRKNTWIGIYLFGFCISLFISTFTLIVHKLFVFVLASSCSKTFRKCLWVCSLLNFIEARRNHSLEFSCCWSHF